MKRTLSAVILMTATLAAPWVSPGAATASTGACTGYDDVTVVVQFPDGHTEIGCAENSPSTGTDVLRQAFGSDFVELVPSNGAICRLGGQPGNANCGRMPSANAYWAFFQDNGAGGWTYSNEGAGTYDAKPGTVEGWRFGGGSAPTTPPPAVPKRPAPKPTPKPDPVGPTKPAATSSGGSTGTPKPAGPRPTAAGVPTGAPSATPGATAPTAASTSTDSPTKAPTAPAAPGNPATAVAAGPLSERPAPDEASGGISWVWGLVLLLGLGAAGGATAVIRRRG